MAEHTRIKLAVYVNLDPVPGAMHSADSARNLISARLNQDFGAYCPTVSIETYNTAHVKYTDQAIHIKKEMLDAGGMFFMKDEAVIGWYCIKSDDPDKRDLYLPPHIFRKCFRWVSRDHEDYPNNFSFVEEIA